MSESVGLDAFMKKKRKRNRKKSKGKSDSKTVNQSLNQQSDLGPVDEEYKNNIEHGVTSLHEEKIKNLPLNELEDALLGLDLRLLQPRPTINNQTARTDRHWDEDWGLTITNNTQQQPELDLQNKDEVKTQSLNLVEGNEQEISVKVEPYFQQVINRQVGEDQISDVMYKVKGLRHRPKIDLSLGKYPTGNLDCIGILQPINSSDDHLNTSANCAVKDLADMPNARIGHRKTIIKTESLENVQQLTSSNKYTDEKTKVTSKKLVTELAATKKNSDKLLVKNIGNIPCKDTKVKPFTADYENCKTDDKLVNKHSKTEVKFLNELGLHDFPPLSEKSTRLTSYDHSTSVVKPVGIKAMDRENHKEIDLSPKHRASITVDKSVNRRSEVEVNFLNELHGFPPLGGKSTRVTSHDHSTSATKLVGTNAMDQENHKEIDLSPQHCASIWDLETGSSKTVHSDQPSPPSGDSPKSRKSKRKWSKLDVEVKFASQNLKMGVQRHTLAEGVVYEAVVVETKRSAFIAVVEQDIRVLVFSSRFTPRGAAVPLQQDVPITCVLKVGDHVRLTAVPRMCTPQQKDGETWVAKECWQERPTLAARETDQVSHQSAVARVGIRAVQLVDGTFVFADVIFLFGFHLAHADVDLRNVFRLGDQLMYTLPHDVACRSGPPEADKSWLGSLPADGHDKPSNQQQFELITFFKERSKDIPMSVITAACGLNKHATGAKDNFEDVYKDIFSTEDQLLATTHADCRTVNGGPLMGVERQNSVEETSIKSVLGNSKQWTKIKNQNKKETETASPTAKSQLVDAATQTHATGDLMCFYTMYCGDSD